MKPYYEHAGITIYHGDCREVLPKLGVADALVTDPPFGIAWGRATWSDLREAHPELMRWLVQSAQLIVPVGWCFVFQAMPNVGRFHEWFPEGWRIFAACKNFGQIRPTGVWHSWDPVVFWRNGQNAGPNTTATNRDYFVHIDRDYFVGDVAGVLHTPTQHPCPKPIDTMRHIVQLAAPREGIVVDPFAGIGSTLLACKQTYRCAIGIEIEERYCEIAAKRLSQEVLALI